MYKVTFTPWMLLITSTWSLNSVITIFTLKYMTCPGLHASWITIKIKWKKRFDNAFREANLFLFTQPIGNKSSFTSKKSLPVRPKTGLGRKKRKKKGKAVVDGNTMKSRDIYDYRTVYYLTYKERRQTRLLTIEAKLIYIYVDSLIYLCCCFVFLRKRLEIIYCLLSFFFFFFIILSYSTLDKY